MLSTLPFMWFYKQICGTTYHCVFQLCNIESDARMLCGSPQVMLPANFTQYLPERSKRQVIDTGMTNQDPNMYNRKNLLQFYIGKKILNSWVYWLR